MTKRTIRALWRRTVALAAALLLATGGMSVKGDTDVNHFRWKPFDKGYVTFVMDDGRSALYPVTELFAQYRMPLCAAVPSATAARDTALRRLLLTIQEAGGEILSHTRSHLVFTRATDTAAMEAELKDSRDELTAMGLCVNGLIYAGGTDQGTNNAQTVAALTAKYYTYADLRDQYDTQPDISAAYQMQRFGCGDQSRGMIKAQVAKAIRAKSWVILYAHDFNDIAREDLIDLLDYVREQQDAGQVEMVTPYTLFHRFGDFTVPPRWATTQTTQSRSSTAKPSSTTTRVTQSTGSRPTAGAAATTVAAATTLPVTTVTGIPATGNTTLPAPGETTAPPAGSTTPAATTAVPAVTTRAAAKTPRDFSPLPVIAAALLVAAAGVGGWWFLRRRRG